MLLITLFERAYDKPGTVACTCNRSDPTGLDPADAWRVGDPRGVMFVCRARGARARPHSAASSPVPAAQRCKPHLCITCVGHRDGMRSRPSHATDHGMPAL